MQVTMLEMRRHPKKILDAMARHETVMLTYRGKPVARIEPIEAVGEIDASAHPAFGMWADRADMADPADYVRSLRKGRFGAV